MNDKEIDEIFGRGATNEVDPALLSRVSASMADLLPVRPMAPQWMLISELLTVMASIAVCCAFSLGPDGIRKLSGAEIGTIFPVLGVLALLAAVLSIGQMTPGSRWLMRPATLLMVVMVAWLSVDAVLFHDYRMGSFVAEGIPCLRAGVAVAVPTGMASWLVLRRGFAVNPANAGLAAGTLAGLAGLTTLELHCANFLAPHVMVWHTAVIPVCGLAGAILARIGARRS